MEGLWALIVIIVSIVLLILCGLVCGRERPDEERESEVVRSQELAASAENVRARTPDEVLSRGANVESRDELSPLLTFKQIVEITENFSHLLGEGRLGISYSGKLTSGMDVRVKKFPISLDQDLKMLLNQVGLLTKVSHENLIKLIGFCPDANALYLVYNYMPRGALSQYIHGSNSDFSQVIFKWEDRLKVAIAAARGIEFLHKVCEPPIIHGAINSNNILLDENLSAKVSEFGIIQLTAQANNTILTSMRGTLGYDKQEEEVNRNLSTESDVYSFGIVLLEMVCGRKPLIRASRVPPYIINIADWARQHVEAGDLESIVDPRMASNCDMASLKKVADMALLCVSEHRFTRPTMKEVLLSLEAETKN